MPSSTPTGARFADASDDMEREGLSRADLEPRIGSRARVSEILSGRRPLTLAMIRRLRDALGIPADILVGGATTNP